MMEWLKQAPTSLKITVIIVCGVIVAGIFAVYTILTLNGADTAEFRQWINTLGQLLVFPLLGIGSVASISAATSAKNAAEHAKKADEQTNGHLTEKEREITSLRSQIKEQDTK